MTTYKLSPRVDLKPGDKIRVSLGPYMRTDSGEKITMAARGKFTVCALLPGRGNRMDLLAYGQGGYTILHIAGRRRAHIEGLVARPYKVRKVKR